jgi:adenylyltransferase/sulfurtransferase
VVIPVAERLTTENAQDLLHGADLVVDGSDTFETRAAVAACESLGIPLVWGVLQEFHAQVTVFWNAPPAGIDPVVLSDLHPADEVGTPPTCAEVGVLGALCLQVGGILAVEAIKLIVGTGEPLLGRVLVIDALRGTQTEVALRGLLRRSDDAAADRRSRRGGPRGDPRADGERDARRAGGRRHPPRCARTVGDADRRRRRLRPDPPRRSPDDPAQIDDEHVVVICAHGIRARHAADALRARGVDADILVGGLAAWQQS